MIFGHWMRAPWPLAAADPGPNVRELQLIFRYSADAGGKCEGCSCAYSVDDAVVAVARKDAEGRTVFHAECFKEAA